MRRLALVSALLLPLVIVACTDDSTASSATDAETGDTTTTTTDASGEPTTTGSSPTTTGTDDPTTGGVMGACRSDADCDDGNACTDDRCNPDGTCRVEAVVSNACRPQIEVDYPPRGSTIVGKPGVPVVTVTGKVTSGAGAIESLLLNDKSVPVAADGTFSVDFTAAPGGNILDFVAQDIAGGTRRRVQSFLWSSEYKKPEVPGEQMVGDGLAFYLAQNALDDADPSLPADDIASVLGIALANLDIAALIDPNTPITSSQGYNIYLTALEFGSARVGLQTRDGGLFISADLEDIVGDLFFDCVEVGCVFAGGDSTGGLSVTKLGVTAETKIWVDAQGQVQV
ncbi:MAG TPA: hypothetical protein VIK91_18605, partial [Nannocystis sp.]